MGEIFNQILRKVAADIRIPATKLFGDSSNFGSSGQDGLENYNGMIESEVREKDKFIIMDVLRRTALNVLEVDVDDFEVSFKPLRILSEEQLEIVKTSQFSRLVTLRDMGIMNDEQFVEQANAASLTPQKIELDQSDDFSDIG